MLWVKKRLGPPAEPLDTLQALETAKRLHADLVAMSGADISVEVSASSTLCAETKLEAALALDINKGEQLWILACR